MVSVSQRSLAEANGAPAQRLTKNECVEASGADVGERAQGAIVVLTTPARERVCDVKETGSCSQAERTVLFVGTRRGGAQCSPESSVDDARLLIGRSPDTAESSVAARQQVVFANKRWHNATKALYIFICWCSIAAGGLQCEGRGKRGTISVSQPAQRSNPHVPFFFLRKTNQIRSISSTGSSPFSFACSFAPSSTGPKPLDAWILKFINMQTMFIVIVL